MNIFSAAILNDRNVLRISGPERESFVQGLITNDVKLAAKGEAIHTALLSPQGKILFDFFLVGADECYLIDCPAAQGADLIKRLNMYKLRSRVEIMDLSGTHSVAACRAGACEIAGAVRFDDPRHVRLGQRIIAAPDALKKHIVEQDDYHLHRIELGIAEGGADFTSGEVYPHEANFDLLSGVSFTKGCYVGQEVVSRMRHKTDIRKRFLPVRLDGPAPEAGVSVLADGKKAGIMGSCAKNSGIALLRFDRIGEDAKLTCGVTLVQVIKPDWADFEIPGAKDK